MKHKERMSSKIMFRGRAVLQFNKDLPEPVYNKITQTLRTLENKYRFTLKSVSIEGNKLNLEIETGRRIHNVILMIRNRLLKEVKELQEYRIGIRDVILEDTTIEITGEYKVSLKIPFVKKVYTSEGKTYVVLKKLTKNELKRPYLDRLIKLIEEKSKKAQWKGKSEHWQLLRRSTKKLAEKKPGVDPNKVLTEVGWIKYFSIGQWFYTPPVTHLVNMIKHFLHEEVLKPLGFKEAIFPKIYPVEIGLKTGHLLGTINSMLFASLPLTYDIESYEEIIDYMYVMDEVPKEELIKYLRPPSYFLCFAQCEPFYQFLSKEVFDDESLPVKWFDQSGPSFRWEAGGLHGLERVIEFHRVEIVWLGRPEQVIEIRNQLLERYEHLLDKVLDLEWQFAWVTPWYYEQSGIVEEEKKEEKIDIDKPGTIDLEAWLPHRGPREDRKSWLEIGNISIHGTKFTDPFKIKHNKGQTLWTGCSGFGTERWLIAFLAQYGFNPREWPRKPREYIEQHPLPESLKAITYPKTEEGKKMLYEIMKYFNQA